MVDEKVVIAPAGLNRVLKAVGKEHFPKNLDREALAQGIDECIELYCAALQYHNDKYEMSQRRRLKLVLNRAKRLGQMMKDDSLWHDNLWGHLSKPAQTPRAVIQTLQDLITRELAERQYDKDDVETSWRHSFQARSPFEALFGDWLPIVYTELGFSGAKSPSELASKNGPFIRFSRAIAGEMKLKKAGRPYAANSFIKAVKDVAAGKVRRALPRERSEVEYYADFHRDRLKKSLDPVKSIQSGQTKIQK
ncbi:hypothetical protein ACFLEY_02185 [Bradyrhizobium sp. YCK136]|uniref:hypothetical protein n=1 Tax=Bradyrhizobium sp. YCK136 TaxID=3351346 RepID=UPI0037C9306A